MKRRIVFPLMALAGSLLVQAQDTEPADPSPPKAQVIEEDESDAPDAPEISDAGDDANSEVSDEEQTALDQPVVDEQEPVDDDGALDAGDIEKKSANEGIQIQVENVSSNRGVNDTGAEVSVSSPWPAKPLDAPPLGWKFIPAPSGVDPYRTTVKLGGTKSVNLAITPYVLVPASDGRNVIRIAEPGYQPEQTHRQDNTIGSILQQSTEEIEYNEKQTSQAIQKLQRLLSSLPQP